MRLTRLPAAMTALWRNTLPPPGLRGVGTVASRVTSVASAPGPATTSDSPCVMAQTLAARWNQARPSGGGAATLTGAMSYSSNLTETQRRAVSELMRVSPVADELGRRFVDAGHELHLVGGSVRDALLGRLGEDLDFCTDARPEQTLDILAGWAEATWETGREFGTIGAARRGL